jgi:hypothetical protein
LERRLQTAGAFLRPHKATSHRKWELPSGATFTTSGQHLSEDAPLNVVKALDRLLERERAWEASLSWAQGEIVNGTPLALGLVTALACQTFMRRRGGRSRMKVREIVSGLADDWVGECSLDDEGGIDRGYCSEFAEDLVGRIRDALGGEPLVVETVDVVLEVPEHLRETLRDQDHTWVLYEGRHYDAEAPHGEKYWWHLPIFVMSGFAGRLDDALRRKRKAHRRTKS